MRRQPIRAKASSRSCTLTMPHSRKVTPTDTRPSSVGDARLLLLHREAIVGRDAVEERWAGFFARFDTSAWATSPELVEVHTDRAYVLSTYTETLVPRGDGPRVAVNGRFVAFLRREQDGAWRIAMLMNSHTRPMEDLP